jgi:hypothetical protein
MISSRLRKAIQLRLFLYIAGRVIDEICRLPNPEQLMGDLFDCVQLLEAALLDYPQIWLKRLLPCVVGLRVFCQLSPNGGMACPGSAPNHKNGPSSTVDGSNLIQMMQALLPFSPERRAH